MKTKNYLIKSLLVAFMGSCLTLPSQAACTASTVTPYVKIAGTWTNTAAATVTAGTSVVFGPQPTTGGSWAWSGTCGTSGTAREQTKTINSSCTATAVYTNSCGTTTTKSITMTVTGMRDLTSLAMSKQMSPGWNLGNSLEAIGGETAWGNPKTTQALISAVKAAGFNSIRIPLSWKQYADSSDNISATWMARVTEVVNYAKNAGLYTIINIHWDGGWMQPTYAQQTTANTRITKFWTQIANNFKGYDDYLIFAGTNEVMVDGNYGTPTVEYYTVQNSFNQTFVNAVRATGGNNAARHLIVQGFNTNVDHTVNYFTKPTDSATSRLMVEIHYYDPYNFTLNTSSDTIWQWGNIATSSSNTETWANESYVDAQMAKLKTKFVDAGIPVVMGEYAAIARLNVSSAVTHRTYWDKYITQAAYSRGIVPVYWDAGATNDHSTGLFNRSTGAQVYPNIISTIVNAAK